jgi:hypothetical protein
MASPNTIFTSEIRIERCGVTDAVKHQLAELCALLDILEQRRQKADGEHAADLQEGLRYRVGRPRTMRRPLKLKRSHRPASD